MAIEVRIPTILRSHTGGLKAVEGSGGTLHALLNDLETRHGGLRERLVTDDGGLHRFVNVYVNDEDVRFLGGLNTELADGDNVTVLPAVAGGAAQTGTAGGAAQTGTAGGAAQTGTAGGAAQAGTAGGAAQAGTAGGAG